MGRREDEVRSRPGRIEDSRQRGGEVQCTRESTDPLDRESGVTQDHRWQLGTLRRDDREHVVVTGHGGQPLEDAAQHGLVATGTGSDPGRVEQNPHEAAEEPGASVGTGVVELGGMCR